MSLVNENLGCGDFAREFKNAIEDKNFDLGRAIVDEWKKKCPSDGNLGFALIWTLMFENETPKTIFMNMNDIYHVAHSRKSADESLSGWYHEFAFGIIKTFKESHGI